MVASIHSQTRSSELEALRRFFECDVFDEKNRLMARANAKMMAMHDEGSAGREVLHRVEANPPSRRKEAL